MREVWKDIVGYEGIYKVSNLGRVKSIPRFINWRGNKMHPRRGRMLKLLIHKAVKCKNYKRYVVNLCKDASMLQHRVHRLVAIAFIPNPLNKSHVNHIDNNPMNNRVENLEWVTSKENAEWCVSQGRTNRGEKNNTAKLTEADVVVIRGMKGVTTTEMMLKYKVTRASIHNILRRITWKHI